MALSKIQSESINLADTFAFTGTVSGAGDPSLVHLQTTTLSSGAATVSFGNTLFTSTYSSYYLNAVYHFDTDNVKTYAVFLEADGTTEINGSSDYKYKNTAAMGSYATSTYAFMFFAQNVGSANNHMESGVHLQAYIHTLIAGADAGNTGASIRPDVMSFYSYANTSSAVDSRQMGARLRLINGNTPVVGTHAIGGLKLYPHTSANFISGSKFSLYGVK